MRTDRLCLAAAAAIFLQVLLLSAVDGPLVAAFNALAYACVTMLLWIATRGSRPLAVPAAVIALGACVQDPFLAAVVASATAATLFALQGKPVCAESSPR